MKINLLTAAIVAAMPTIAHANEMLETVVVSAARDGINISEAGSSISIIDSSLIELRANAPVAQLLRSTPSIAISQTSGIGSQTQLRMRGGEANHVLVLIDGVEANDAAQGDDFNFAHLLNQNIESVEVVRGPQSALWGSDALSGVINIKTRGFSDKSLSLFTELGTLNSSSYGFSGVIGEADSYARISHSHFETDGENVSRAGAEKDGYQNDSSQLKFGYTLTSNIELRATYNYVDSTSNFDKLDYDTDANWLPLNPDTYGLPVDAPSYSESTQQYGSGYVIYHSDDESWQHQLHYQHSETENDNYDEGWMAGTFDVTHSQTSRDLLALQSSWQANDNLRITGLVEQQEQDYQLQGQWLSGDESMDAEAVALELKGAIGDVHYLASVRRDYNDDFNDANTHRLSAAWQANATLRLRAATGTGIKNPTFTELFGYSASFVGNSDLQPEKSKSWEVGFDQSLFNQDLMISATYFDEELDNEIATIYDYNNWTSTAINETGTSERKGFELAANYRINNQWQAGLSYSDLDAVQPAADGTREREIRRPETTANLHVSWQSSDQQTRVLVNADYNGDMLDNYWGALGAESKTMDSYMLISINMSHKLTDSLELYARVDNALGENYEEIYGFQTLGRQSNIGLRLQF